MRKIAGLLVLLLAMIILMACSGEQKEGYEEAQQNLKNGHYEEALAGFQESIANEYRVAESYRGQGIACLKLGDYEEAIKAFVLAETALVEGRNNHLRKDIYLYKAMAEYRSGDISQALVDCRAAVDALGDAQGFLFLGKLYLEQNDYGEAQEAFRSAIKEDDSYDMYVNIYRFYAQEDMNADGEEYLAEALEKGGSSQEDYYQRGRIYFFMGDTENARRELMESSNKGFGEAKLLLGKVYLTAGDSANARVMYQQYLEQGERMGSGYNGLALCDMAEGNYVSALEEIKQGLAVAETDEVQGLMFNEAVIYEKMLDFQTARDKMEAYLNLYPDDEAAQRELEFLLYR